MQQILGNVRERNKIIEMHIKNQKYMLQKERNTCYRIGEIQLKKNQLEQLFEEGSENLVDGGARGRL